MRTWFILAALTENRLASPLIVRLIAQLKSVWWALVTVDIVLILKYLYEPTDETVSMGPQLVKDGSAS